MSKTMTLVPPKLQKLEITLVGDSPLLVNRYHAGEVGGGRNKPEDEYLSCVYHYDDKTYGFPSSGVKNSWLETVNNQVKGITKTYFRGAIFMTEDLFPLTGSEPRHYESMVRTERGQMVKAIKAMFWPWELAVNLNFLPGVITPDQIANIAMWSGITQGLGARSPHFGGTFGVYHVKPPEPTEDTESEEQ